MISAHQSSPVIPKDFNGNQPKTIRLFPLSNYTFGTKDGQPEEDPSVLARLKRLEEHYSEHGMRRTCEGILVCHEHNHPHILMLQIANAFFKLYELLSPILAKVSMTSGWLATHWRSGGDPTSRPSCTLSSLRMSPGQRSARSCTLSSFRAAVS